jgi:hypothetical protein
VTFGGRLARFCIWPTIWGDAALALVEVSGLLVSIEETLSEETSSTHEPDTKTALCTVCRSGRLNPITRSFSVHDAIRAGLWQKPGPWTDYPDRMLMMRARAFALRDAFPDVLSGLYLREEFERGQGDRDNDRDRERERYKDTDTEWDKQTDPYKGSDLDGDLRSRPSTAQQQDKFEHSDQKPDRASLSKTNLYKYKRRAPPPPSMQDSKTSQSIEPAAAAPDLSPTGSLLAAEGVALQADITSSDMLLSSETDPDQSSAGIDLPEDLSSPENHLLTPAETLQLFDDALCCAFDLETLEEIREDFQERLDPLNQEDTDKAARIFLNHERRIEDAEKPYRRPASSLLGMPFMRPRRRRVRSGPRRRTSLTLADLHTRNRVAILTHRPQIQDTEEEVDEGQ